MSEFLWRDRRGVTHSLDSRDLIVAEMAEIVAKLKTFTAALEAENPETYEAAMRASEPLVQRHNVLVSDCERWNQHISVLTAASAADLLASIDALRAEVDTMRVLHRYLAEYEKLDRDIAAGIRLSSATDAPVTADQQRLLTSVLKLPATAASSINEARSLLQADPRTNRDPLPEGASSFLSTDRQGRPHDVRDLREIEVEYIAAFDALDTLLPALKGQSPSMKVTEALVASVASANMVNSLKGNFEGWARHCASLRQQEAHARAQSIKDLQK